jgi:hypothetical protein
VGVNIILFGLITAYYIACISEIILIIKSQSKHRDIL